MSNDNTIAACMGIGILMLIAGLLVWGFAVGEQLVAEAEGTPIENTSPVFTIGITSAIIGVLLMMCGLCFSPRVDLGDVNNED